MQIQAVQSTLKSNPSAVKSTQDQMRTIAAAYQGWRTHR